MFPQRKDRRARNIVKMEEWDEIPMSVSGAMNRKVKAVAEQAQAHQTLQAYYKAEQQNPALVRRVQLIRQVHATLLQVHHHGAKPEPRNVPDEG